jgi:hypothetical protein
MKFLVNLSIKLHYRAPATVVSLGCQTTGIGRAVISAAGP